jgi:hypothetical protein
MPVLPIYYRLNLLRRLLFPGAADSCFFEPDRGGNNSRCKKQKPANPLPIEHFSPEPYVGSVPVPPNLFDANDSQIPENNVDLSARKTKRLFKDEAEK